MLLMQTRVGLSLSVRVTRDLLYVLTSSQRFRRGPVDDNRYLGQRAVDQNPGAIRVGQEGRKGGSERGARVKGLLSFAGYPENTIRRAFDLRIWRTGSLRENTVPSRPRPFRQFRSPTAGGIVGEDFRQSGNNIAAGPPFPSPTVFHSPFHSTLFEFVTSAFPIQMEFTS